MNPQPNPIVGQLGVLIFSLLVAYFCFTNKRKNIEFSDSFVIGHIYDSPPAQKQMISQRTRSVTTQHQVKRKNKIPNNLLSSIKEDEPIDNILYEDCVLALISIGTKKTQAKRITQEIFEKHNPKTIEDFIKFVYIK